MSIIVGGAMPSQLNTTFSNDEFERLKEEKGDRSWREAVLEEFGVKEDG